jgi:hypothetical protein
MQCFVGLGAGVNVIYVAVVAKISLSKRAADSTGLALSFAEEPAENQGLNSVTVAAVFCRLRTAARAPKF